MKRILRSVLSVFLIVAMLSGSLGMLAVKTDAYSYLAYGIDVSAWQGVIDWNKVKAAGIDFAILRIMASGKDTYFESNYNNAKAAGVKLGVYIYSYADTVAEAQTEANKVLSYINGRTLEYPVYYDIEDPNVHAVLTKAQRTALCDAFCGVIQANGYRAGIYSTTYWFNNYLDRANLTAKYEIWEAVWPTSGGTQVKEPIYDKSSTYGMWQYTSEGSIPGISGYVDRNVSYKDYASYMIANGLNGYGNGSITPGLNTANGYYQTTTSVNFRTGPSTSNNIIATLAAGTQVGVTGFNEDNTWAHVIYNGNEGWISKTYLTYIRGFAYNLHYLTNNSTTMASSTFQYGSDMKVGTPTADVADATVRGLQLLRFSDFVWYTGSGWSANQKDAKMFAPGDTITFDDTMFNTLAGDDNFYLGVVWDSPASIKTVTPTDTIPEKWAWQWDNNQAYGIFENYGTNEQDVELSVDLCLLPSSETSVAAFYNSDLAAAMTVSPTQVTVGTKTVAYDWGVLSEKNWRNVKFKVLDGYGYVFIDGELIAYDSGITAPTIHQLLFSLTGEMAIDNAIMMSSDGTTYFNCDFEDEAEATKLMGSGLGQRVLFSPDTSDFIVNISAPETAILGKGSVTFTATPTAGEGHSYSWSSSNSALRSYMITSGSVLTINIPSELASSLTSTITCTVTSDGGVTSESTVDFTYTPYPIPTIDSITPASTTITDTGIATFTASATGEGLQYKWTCSDPALNAYLSGANTSTLTVNIPEALAEEFSAALTCTVTNTYGKTVTSEAVSLEYKLTPAPVEPDRKSGDINGDDQITASDLNIAKRYAAGVYTIEEGSAAFIAADLNGDGMITAKDIGLLLKMLI